MRQPLKLTASCSIIILLCGLFVAQPEFALGQSEGSTSAAKQDKDTEYESVIPVWRDAKWWTNRHTQKLAAKEKMGEVDLLMIGDSITHSWEGAGKATWDKFYGDRKALNIGYSGDRTEHVIWRLQHGEVDGISPKLAVIMIGTNNTGHRMGKANRTAAGIKAIIGELQTRLPETKILLLGIFPRANKPDAAQRKLNDAINAIVKDFADEENVWYLDIGPKFLDDEGVLTKEIMPDFLHPKEKGYGIWAEAMEPMIVKLMGEKSE